MTETAKANRRVLLAIAGIPLLIIVAASALWYLVASGRVDLVAMLGTSNRGDLLQQPLHLPMLELVDARGVSFDPTAGKPRWRILVRGGASCDEDCQQVLYYTRQIHTAMGKYQNRIERVFAVSAEPGESSIVALQAKYPALKVLYTSTARLDALMSAPAAGVPAIGPPAAGSPAAGSPAANPQAAYYVVDPRGWVILSYAVDADGKDLMTDLKFLLKNSNG